MARGLDFTIERDIFHEKLNGKKTKSLQAGVESNFFLSETTLEKVLKEWLYIPHYFTKKMLTNKQTAF